MLKTSSLAPLAFVRSCPFAFPFQPYAEELQCLRSDWVPLLAWHGLTHIFATQGMDACRAWELPSALFHGDASGWKELAENSGHTVVAILGTLLEHTPLDNECIGDILNWMECCHSAALLVILPIQKLIRHSSSRM